METREDVLALLNSALDVLCDMFGAEWLIDWGLENDMSDEDILNYLVDDPDLLERVKWKRGEDE
jgi:hypothetical protein